MSRRTRAVLSVVGVLVAVALFGFALTQATMTYPLPTPGGVIRRTTTFTPGVVASVVAGLALLGAIGTLVWNLVKEPPRWVLPGLGVLVVAAAVVDVVAATSSRPLF